MGKYIISVRYGQMNEVENFLAEADDLAPGQVVIIRTDRGVDWGETAGKPTPVEREVKGLGEVLRVASEHDLNIIRHIREVKEAEEMHYCASAIQKRKLPMKLAAVEHLFSGDKIVFYFLADGRVDFRELVKELARRYRTRIEMRQIGVRDEARMLSDYEHCGRELCCRTFLRNLEPITMRMAKMQKTTLDPTKISGHCGRLMCCLRFEDEVYAVHKRELPGKGERVRTAEVEGVVIDTQLLSQKVTLRLPDGDCQAVHLAEIVERKGRPSRGGKGRSDENRRDRHQGDDSGHCRGCPAGEGKKNDGEGAS